MKASPLLLVFSAYIASLPLNAQPPPQPPPPPCTPAADVVCGQQAPEDLVALGPQWVVASAYSGTGGVALIRVSDRMAITAYPSAAAQERPDKNNYPRMPRTAEPGGAVHDARVYVEPGNGPTYKLFVVGHGAREAIEVFEIDTAREMPVVTWIGCVIAPEPIGLNSVRGLPDGGFITTNFLPRGGTREATAADDGRRTERRALGVAHGERLEESPGQRGRGRERRRALERRQDVVRRSLGQPIVLPRLSRGATPPARDEIPLGFRVDNIHWARDGTLIGRRSGRAELEGGEDRPATLAVREIVSQPDTPEFGAGTALVEVGDKLWVGSYRGNRIAIVPAP